MKCKSRKQKGGRKDGIKQESKKRASIESPRVITDMLQRVMNSAARVVTDTRKYDSGLSRLMHDELHWLDVTDRVRFKLAVLMYRCLYGTAT